MSQKPVKRKLDLCPRSSKFQHHGIMKKAKTLLLSFPKPRVTKEFFYVRGQIFPD